MPRTPLAPTVTAFLLLLGADSALAAAQDTTTPARYGWNLSLGVGPGGGSFGSGGAGVATLHFRRDRVIVGVRAAGATEVDLFGPSPSLSDSDMGVLVGRHMAAQGGYIVALVGLGTTTSVRRGRRLDGRSCLAYCGIEHEKVVARRMSVPFEVRAVVSGRNTGVGLSVFGSVAPRTSFVGVAVVLDSGLLR